MRINKSILAASGVALVLGVSASSASATPVKITWEGTPGTSVPEGTTFEATATNGKLVDYSTGNTAATCTTVTATGIVTRLSGVDELRVNGLSFVGCSSPIIGPFSVATSGLPWYFSATKPAGANGFPASMTNWSTAGASITSTLGCTTSYSTSVAPTGFFVNNVSGGSVVKGIKAGPLNKAAGGCALPAVAGITGDIKITKVNGATVTTATNFWAS